MEAGTITSFLFLSAFTAVSAWLIYRSSCRQVTDVFFDLADTIESPPESPEGTPQLGVKNRFTDELGNVGIIERHARRLFHLQQRLIPPAFGFAAAVSALLIGASDPGTIVPLLVGGTALGYLFSKHRLRTLRRRYIRSIEHSLPIVMERIVMAVQSGLDVIPAIDRITADDTPITGKGSDIDPVIRLLRLVSQMANRGIPLPQALRNVAEFVDCPALRHAFIHLAVAHQEGGELVVPLRELSDASQLQYQESVEEEIAALPIKATMPLLCTFAGLILIFITAPLIQIITMTAEAIPK